MKEESAGSSVQVPGKYLRKFAAVSSAVLLATDYYRDPAIFSSFSMWTLILHFIYFQLPVKSRALAYFHGISFVASLTTPCTYLYLLHFRPSLEEEHMHAWQLPSTMIYLRTAAVYIAPLCYHLVEQSLYPEALLASYRYKSLSIIGLWTVACLSTLSFVYEFTFPDSDETESLQGINKDDYFRWQKVIFFGIVLLAFALYTQFILRPAARLQSSLAGSRRSSGNLSEKVPE